MNTAIPRRAVLAGALLTAGGLAGCTSPSDGASQAEGGPEAEGASFRNLDLGCDLGVAEEVGLSYATHLTMDALDDGLLLVCMASGDRLLLAPAEWEAPEGLSDDVALVRLPLDNVYLVSTGMICLVEAVGALGAVSVSSVRPADSPSPDFAERLEDGRVAYGGLYRAPDYELIAARGCPLALENTNIDHVPEVRAKLEELGVTVLMEQSSREEHVLGRLEWIRLVGALFGRDDEARAVFDEVAARVEAASREEPTGKSVAFFYLNEDGAAVTRRAGDYLSQMIELAGGSYVSFSEDGATDSSPTTVTVEMERFYASARDADVIIYNATVDDGVSSVEELVSRNALLGDFRAVREGNVWTCDSTMYQQMTAMADIIEDIRRALTDSAEPTTYVWRLS